MDKSVFFYSVKLPVGESSWNFRWQKGHAEGDEESAEAIILAQHPDLLDYNLDSVGSSRFSDNAGLGPFRVDCGKEIPDIFDDNSPRDVPSRPRPLDKAIFAEFCSYADPPDVGWWPLYLVFRSPNSAPDKFMASVAIWCSNVFDPRDELQRFIAGIEANLPAAIAIWEEGPGTVLESWPIDEKQIQLCLTDMDSDEPAIQYNFILDKHNFTESIRQTYQRDFLDYIEALKASGDKTYAWYPPSFDDEEEEES